MTAVLFTLFAFFLAFQTASATVTVSLPLESQLPLVARVGQPYEWAISPYTFNSSDNNLNITTSALPGWLTFDASSRTFSGTPNATDEGSPEITLTARGSSFFASSKFNLCVSSNPPPTLNRTIQEQFTPTSASLASVYLLRPNSALKTDNPAVRVPLSWSFSIGFEWETFVNPEGNVYYETRLANGSEPPDFMVWSSDSYTLDGVVPGEDKIKTTPVVYSFLLHASDEEGYTSQTLAYDVILANHELSLATNSLPTINITDSTSFSVSLLSSSDFMGVLVDGEPIQASNITDLFIDVSSHSDWLKYDNTSRTLSGISDHNATDPNPTLPVVVRTIFNQTINTTVSIAIVPSFFSMEDLPSLNVSKGDAINFTLSEYFVRPDIERRREHTNITVAFEPGPAANWLRYDANSTNLTGAVPSDWESDEDHVTCVFTAYERDTHSTSHAILRIYVAGTGHTKALAPTHPSGLSTEAHRKLVLAIVVTFGVLGGMCLLGGFFALVRRCARVEDTALLGEEGRHAWNEKDRRWYGLSLSPHGTRILSSSAKMMPTIAGEASSPGLAPPAMQVHVNTEYGHLGLGLRRVSERSQSQHPPHGDVSSVISKREFLARIRETVRQVSGARGRRAHAGGPRPIIGKPILIASTKILPGQTDSTMHVSPSNPFEDLPSRPGSTFMTGSPSTSTAEHSIPRRRADFAPPRSMAQVHFADGRLARKVSTGSMAANSLKSGKSGVSGESLMEPQVPMGPPTRPRLVPFTSSTRVPVPQAVIPAAGTGGAFQGNRIASQRAKVMHVESPYPEVIVEEHAGLKASRTSDELSMGIHYVRSLGVDQLGVQGPTESSPELSNVRSSFTSLESSHAGNKSNNGLESMKVLVRAGDRFKFRVSVPPAARELYRQADSYTMKQISGQPMPKFMQADFEGVLTKGTVEITGLASFRDLGEYAIGVYVEKDSICVASVMIEVVGKR
ncbi:hypothetical protein CVT24_002753 [Panaeolus cyanescens]|uniref:Dystroglycan-type cadherin-like domain-containing protein n=1 Tax=Panaeolus cyanescens TaxID=181874 RepID=A0A409VN80_9AGAR|nr:hypothetical protein CVT24_002753 [Panaeolus cyanescens]